METVVTIIGITIAASWVATMVAAYYMAVKDDLKKLRNNK